LKWSWKSEDEAAGTVHRMPILLMPGGEAGRSGSASAPRTYAVFATSPLCRRYGRPRALDLVLSNTTWVPTPLRLLREGRMLVEVGGRSRDERQKRETSLEAILRLARSHKECSIARVANTRSTCNRQIHLLPVPKVAPTSHVRRSA
jgi:hypothetical protein